MASHRGDASRDDRLVRVLVGMADTLVSDFDPVDPFFELMTSCTDLLDVAQAGLLSSDGDGCLGACGSSSVFRVVPQGPGVRVGLT